MLSRLTLYCAVVAVLLFPNALLAHSETGSQSSDMRQLLQLAEYVGVDYSEAVANGEVINAAEYSEMTEFSELIREKVEHAPSSVQVDMRQLSAQLKERISNKADASVVITLTSRLRDTLLSAMPKLSLPSQLASKARVKQLFQQNCAMCHGGSGRGDGPGAQGLEPAPTDFTDSERANNRSLLGLFDAVSDGIEGTAMAPFSYLSEEERWALTFYVGSLAFDDTSQAEQSIELNHLVNYSPNTLLKRNVSSETIDYARTHAREYFTQGAQASPIVVAQRKLKQALSAYQSEHYSEAKRLAISAYLDGFELAENALNAKAPQLMVAIERDMMALRSVINQPGNVQQVEQMTANLQQQLSTAASSLSDNELSESALFTASAVILLREGLEALLVVLAIGTVLARSGRKDGLRYVHAGWVFALIAGGGTWFLAQYVINISGASREIIEGGAALLAAGVLFYVGYWMHSKTQAQQWQQFIHEKVHVQLQQGALWGLAGLAFLAVYREVFETVLFYQSLLLQAGESRSSVAYGFVFGVVFLAIVAWAVIRYSVKLPISTFFKVTTYVMLALVFILLGKGVSALQEAAWISHTVFPINISFDWLGLYASWETIGLQLIYLVAVGRLLFKRKVTTEQA